jgi:HEAT repeats
MRYRLLLVPVLLYGLAAPLSAGIIFGKKPKTPPEKRVPELLLILKSDGDENKRSEAAEELRQFDGALFKEIIPALIESLMSDPKASVRVEAAQSLGKIRPPVREMLAPLEHARDHDASMRVRMQARSSLMNLHFAGLRSAPGDLKQDKPPPPSTKEPPLAPTAPPLKPVPPKDPPQAKPIATTPPPPAPRPAPLPPVIETPPIPSTPPPIINTNPGNYQPLPKSAPPEEKGPVLGPPQ